MATFSNLLQSARKSPEFLRAKRMLQNDYALLRSLVAARNRAGLNQKQLGQKMGVTQQAVSKIEQLDGDPRLSTLRRYANAVGVVIEHACFPSDGTEYSARRHLVIVPEAEVPVVTIERSAPAAYLLGAATAKRTDFALGA